MAAELLRAFIISYPIIALSSLAGSAWSRGTAGDMANSGVADDVISAALWPLTVVHGLVALTAFRFRR